MNIHRVTRRNFVKQCAGLSATLLAGSAAWGTAEPTDADRWRAMREDPVCGMFDGPPDLDKILALFPRTQGPAAFEPAAVAESLARLKTAPAVNTGHPFLDLSVNTGLAFIDLTFRGDHPKYGVAYYAGDIHDGFPPTIIAAIDALSAWGVNERADRLFDYWLTNFVKDDGTINYYGPSISEYGQLLHTAALLEERAGTGAWWQEGRKAIDRLAEYLLRLCAAAEGDGLIAGSPEADTRKDVGKYFHNNGWVVKGLRRYAHLCERRQITPTTPIETIRKSANKLAADTLRAIEKTWPSDPADWWLPPMVDAGPRPASMTATRLSSYTNYRYWPELLSSGLLPETMANRVVESRLTAGGQFCGMTRFTDHLDDWPLADYLYGLWTLGRRNDFLLSLYGHIAYHQAEGHLTAYEQVTFPPGRKAADYCLPCQLVAARAARLLVES